MRLPFNRIWPHEHDINAVWSAGLALLWVRVRSWHPFEAANRSGSLLVLRTRWLISCQSKERPQQLESRIFSLARSEGNRSTNCTEHHADWKEDRNASAKHIGPPYPFY